jgi:hypothetical protein
MNIALHQREHLKRKKYTNNDNYKEMFSKIKPEKHIHNIGLYLHIK